MKKVQQRDSQIGNEFKKKTQLKKGTYDLKGKGTHQELTLIPMKNVGNNSDDLQFVQIRTVD